MIVILHHAARGHGGARGSTAISAAVAEVWNIKTPAKDSGLSVDQRVITVGKSRINRSGETLIQTQEEDLTVSLVEVAKKEEMQTRAGSVGERIMNRLQTKDEWVSRQELNSDPLVGGSVAAIKKTLQRLENRGVIEVMEKPSPQGKPIKLFRAIRVRPCGGCVKRGQDPLNPVEDYEEKGDTLIDSEQCPLSKSSPGAPSEGKGTDTPYIGKRSLDEINAAIDTTQWD